MLERAFYSISGGEIKRLLISCSLTILLHFCYTGCLIPCQNSPLAACHTAAYFPASALSDNMTLFLLSVLNCSAILSSDIYTYLEAVAYQHLVRDSLDTLELYKC